MEAVEETPQTPLLRGFAGSANVLVGSLNSFVVLHGFFSTSRRRRHLACASGRAPGGMAFRFFCLDALGQPNLVDGLASHSSEGSLFIEFGNQPTWQIHIDAAGHKTGPVCLVPIEKFADVVSLVKATIEFLSGYCSLSLLHLLISIPI